MIRGRLIQVIAIAAASRLCTACPDDIQAYRPCDAGVSEPCTCPDGAAGAAACSSDGRLGACDCGDIAQLDLDAAVDEAPAETAADGVQTDMDGPPPLGRVELGLLALYTFGEGQGDQVRDRAGDADAEDLAIGDPSAIAWLPDGGLELVEPTRLRTPAPATALTAALVQAGELTVEAWVEPAVARASGPARIVTLAGDGEALDFMLGHGSTVGARRDEFRARVRTSETSEQAWPGLATPEGTARTELTHLVLTRSASGELRIYVDGEAVASGTVAGDFSTWQDDYALSLGNDPDGGDPFLGTYRLVAVFDRALTAAEVAQNFAAGLD